MMPLNICMLYFDYWTVYGAPSLAIPSLPTEVAASMGKRAILGQWDVDLDRDSAAS